MTTPRKITVVGAGYVGMSLAASLVNHNKVTICDIDIHKNKMINEQRSTINDPKIDELLVAFKKNIVATNDIDLAFVEAEYIFISVPTNFNEKISSFETEILENVIQTVREKNQKAIIIIKSTIPIGFTRKLCVKNNYTNIIYNPEFLREGHELNDTLNPSRVIFGYSKDVVSSKEINNIKSLYKKSFRKKDINFLEMKSDEAESVKLHSNAYLAMRVAFFNELDSFCHERELSTKNVISGISPDSRIGDFYNNPSFGYGGYCLPKDSKQLLTSYGNTPQKLISSVVESNELRKEFISKKINSLNAKTIGIYRLISKNNSQNYRESAVLDIIEFLSCQNKDLLIYEPTMDDNEFKNISVINDLNKFKELSDVIVANRMHNELNDVQKIVFTRDIYNTDI